MGHTLVAVYDSYSQAQGAYNDLLAGGFQHAAVQLSPSEQMHASGQPATGTIHAGPAGDGHSVGSGIRHFFMNLFGSHADYQEHADVYSEAVRRGHYILTVNADDDEESERAVQIMNRFDPVDVDERTAQWKSRGWSQYDEHAPRMSEAEIAHERSYTPARPPYYGEMGIGGEDPALTETITEAVEHAPDSGRVRTYPRQQASALTGGIGETMRTGTEQASSPETAGQAGTDTSGGDDDYRRHFQSAYSEPGDQYDDYAHAYRHGSTAAADERYRGYHWEDAEPNVRQDWESGHEGRTPWEKAKAAIRHGWEKVSRR